MHSMRRMEEMHIEGLRKFGIRFDCSFDQELRSGLNAEIKSGKMPYEGENNYA